MAIGAVTLYIVLNANISVKKKEIFVVLLSTRQAKYRSSMSRYRYDHLETEMFTSSFLALCRLHSFDRNTSKKYFKEITA